jgi:hypothetical protein
MPYIEQDRRYDFDEMVREMGDYGIKANGDLNYILYAFCKRYVFPSYDAYKNYCGELHQCATEIERTILAPYEDEKIKENGGII